MDLSQNIQPSQVEGGIVGSGNGSSRKRSRASLVMDDNAASNAASIPQRFSMENPRTEESVALGGVVFRISPAAAAAPATAAAEKVNLKRRKSALSAENRQFVRSASSSSEDSDSSGDDFCTSWSAILQSRAENSLRLATSSNNGMHRVRSHPSMLSPNTTMPFSVGNVSFVAAHGDESDDDDNNEEKGGGRVFARTNSTSNCTNATLEGKTSSVDSMEVSQKVPYESVAMHQSSSMPTILASAAAAVAEAEKRVLFRGQTSEGALNLAGGTKTGLSSEGMQEESVRILDAAKLPPELQALLEEGGEFSNNNNTNPESFLKTLLEAKGYTKLVYHSSLDLPNFFLEHTEEQVAAYDTEITTAVRREDITEMRRLMKSGHTMQCANRFGETILHIACRRGSLAMVKFLVEEGGASVRVRDDLGRTVLHDACWTAKPALDVMSYLLQLEPQLLWVTDKRGFSPLGYARRDHWDQWCNFLLENRNVLRGPRSQEIHDDGKRRRKNSDVMDKPARMIA